MRDIMGWNFTTLEPLQNNTYTSMLITCSISPNEQYLQCLGTQHLIEWVCGLNRAFLAAFLYFSE